MDAYVPLLRFALVSALVAMLGARATRSGAAGVALGALCGALRLPPRPDGLEMTLWPIAAGSLIALAAGTACERRPRGGSFALAGALIAAASLAVLAGGVRLEFHSIPVPILAAATVLWLGLSTAGLAILPDRLSAGVAGAIGGTLAAVNLNCRETPVAAASAALAGACLGFLPLAWPRARCTLGAGGRAMIGFALAALALAGVYTRWAPLPWMAVFIPAILFAVPLLDLVLAAALRRRAGLPLWRLDRGHVGERLSAAGRDSPAAAPIVWATAAAAGAIGFFLRRSGGLHAALLAGAAIGVLAAFALATRARRAPIRP